MSTAFTESELRHYEALSRDLGDLIHRGLADSDVDEIMLNPDGGLWFDSPTTGMTRVGELTRNQADSIIGSVAGASGLVVTPKSPLLEAQFPIFGAMKGERFTAEIPPVVSAPSFTLRKRAERIFSLADYVETGRLTSSQCKHLVSLVHERANILVCGGPGSGKTTVTNALIQEAVNIDTAQRFILLQDVPELQCKAENSVPMETIEGVNMTRLLRAAMRKRPDRILVGEVRGAEAHDMLKMWNTGCPGGVCTVHANGTKEALQRILDLAMESGLLAPPLSLLLTTIQAVVFVVRHGSQKGFIKEIARLKGINNGEFVTTVLD